MFYTAKTIKFHSCLSSVTLERYHFLWVRLLMYVLNDFLKITLSHFLRTETTNEVISTPNCPGFILYALSILFYATRTRLCDYMKHVLLAKYFTPITVCKGVGVLIPHKRSFFKENPASRYFFSISFSRIPLLLP